MSFGNTIRYLRKEKGYTQRDLAEKVGINFTYLSKIENDKLKQIQFPSEDTIIKLARELEANEEELLLLAEKVPENIRQRVIQKPEVFRKLSSFDDEQLDKLLKEIEKDEKE